MTTATKCVCEWCGDSMDPNPTGRHRRYCCQSCRQRAYERRVFGGRALIERLSIESGTTCALCGGPLDLAVKTGPDCPVADHMIPAAFGGATSAENLHVVHARCNTAKGAAMFWVTA